MQLHQQMHMQVRNRPGNQRQHADASDSGPPDPPVGPPGHGLLPTRKSADSTPA
jgi:hypothetical protein